MEQYTFDTIETDNYDDFFYAVEQDLQIRNNRKQKEIEELKLTFDDDLECDDAIEEYKVKMLISHTIIIYKEIT